MQRVNKLNPKVEALKRASSPCRKISDPDKRKTSRVHLGRVQHMPNCLVADEPNPDCPITTYEFLSAAAAGAMKTATKYLDDGGSIFATDECGRTALDRSALYSQPEMTEFLLKRGAKPNVADKLGGTSLHWGCRSGNVDIVTILLNHGAKVNQKDNLLNTPLHVATRVGFEEGVHHLLECGAKINEQDTEGDTAVHDAVRMGRHAIVKDLIIHGADLEIKNKTGKTAKDMVQTWYKETRMALEKMKAEEKQNSQTNELPSTE
ncbi:uncharacterized protein LOC120339348 [Styela clava]|uniref:ankyrin repeat domain-containing protein 2-like n=1 Tax=Styela clava TaxID=7725 RepID=UPI00193938F0|nr:ankyrin repeat domain-containing protein 2-like [Styela clava]